MPSAPTVRFLTCFALLAVLFSPLAAEDKPVNATGQVKVGVHKHKLEAGKLYQVKVEGEGFIPNVNLRPGYFVATESLNQGDTFQAFILPNETKEHRITILPSAYDEIEEKTFDYKFSLTPIPLAAKPMLEEKSKLTNKDPLYAPPYGDEKRPHKAFPIQLKARQVYIITLKSGTKDFEPYLYLENSSGMQAASNFNAGEGTSRIFVQPRRNGEYRIIATTYSKELGDFTLTVQTTEKADKPEK